jgi:hypothetical protein
MPISDTCFRHRAGALLDRPCHARALSHAFRLVEAWRMDVRKDFHPLVGGASTPHFASRLAVYALSAVNEKHWLLIVG